MSKGLYVSSHFDARMNSTSPSCPSHLKYIKVYKKQHLKSKTLYKPAGSWFSKNPSLSATPGCVQKEPEQRRTPNALPHEGWSLPRAATNLQTNPEKEGCKPAGRRKRPPSTFGGTRDRLVKKKQKNQPGRQDATTPNLRIPKRGKNASSKCLPH